MYFKCCIAVSDYDGTYCEVVLDPCMNYCPPDINCVLVDGEPACQCEKGEMFVGQSCKGR